MSFFKTLFEAGADIVGGLISNSANSSAAQTANDATTRAAEIYAETERQGREQELAYRERALQAALDAEAAARGELRAAGERGIDAIREGTGQAVGTLAPVAAQYGPAVANLNRIAVADPYNFTPSQQILLDDTANDVRASLAASGLRGAGRSGVAVFNDVMNRQRARLHEENQARSDNALSTLTNIGTTGIRDVAGLQAGQGSNIAATETGVGTGVAGSLSRGGSTSANILSGSGDVVGSSLSRAGATTADAARRVGETTAESDLANARVLGSTLGSISASVADEIKQQALKGRSFV